MPEEPNIRIEQASSASAEIVEAVGCLVGQLSSSARAPGAEQVEQLLASSATTLLLAREHDGRIVGMLTLAMFPIPTGMRAWIEDVVVDREARGRGVGSLLTIEALRLARVAGARTVDLTSRPSREAANRLYVSLGFRPRETNVYRHDEQAG
ncbi:MAG: GNAT family N-acetyltransferase [Solirubrobacteraceae bacterium]|jgi:ribosomal protein S18 acetylase RimI-like enzyme